jgi:group I intron endonuclease
MITYLAINLSSKKFQVGSTTDFSRRLQEHMRGSMNPEFSRSLQKDPNNFYWFKSVDDGLQTREEEQYYLDVYCGSPWCYNVNPFAESPPNRKGAEWSEESKLKLSRTIKGLCWVNDGEKTFRVPMDQKHLYREGRGKTYNNGVKECTSLSHPGEGWVLGQTQSHKVCFRGRKKCGAEHHGSLPIYLKRVGEEKETYYESVTAACKEYGLQKSNLIGVIKGKRKQHKGFTARYA